eukprot:633227-Ditylum_brightwellii.AAC.1
MVNTWKAEGNTVFWMRDANSSLEDDDLAEVLSETELYDIMGSNHCINSPKTHINQSQAIDFYLGTTDALDTVDKAGIMKFNVRIDFDHHGMFIGINQQHL